VTAWPSLRAAALSVTPRTPFFVRGARVGSVAASHIDALRPYGAALRIDARGVHTIAADPSEDLAPINRALHAAGLVRAWREELFTVPDPRTLEPLARIERAASRFWGTLTFGAHATGFVRGANGRPSHLWIAQRALNKATDPGLFDNLIGGGVGAGQAPRETLVREAFEEAGLAPAEAERATPGRIIGLARDIAEGYQQEWLYSFDIELPAGRVPVNQDGEVAGFTCLTVADAAALAAGDSMTVDASLVTLDFLLRHGLLEEPAAAALREALAPLLITPPR
jgi:8-oxo-dGTP pyrophosphatase MutT (NUDIX family)